MARLDDATAQMELSKNFKDWSTVIFPGVYLDKESAQSFQNYQVWYSNKAKEAKMTGYMGQKKKRRTIEVPSFHIGVVRMNLMMLWSVRESSTVVSIGGEPRYFASWSTPTMADGKSWAGKLFDSIFGSCTRGADSKDDERDRSRSTLGHTSDSSGSYGALAHGEIPRVRDERRC